MIQVEHLSRHYGETAAVRDVSFSIDRGEVVGLLGHNGAGKTTIMKMLTGYLEPTSGSIQVDGLSMGEDTRAIQSRIGYLPENCPLWPEQRVIDYLEYQAVLHGVPADRRNAAVASALRRTDLLGRASAPIHALSRGYRQRVGVAQAILHDPDIVILDEPTNGLDPTQIRHMRELIAELARQSTVIVSTHILQEVQAVCQRVLILRAGELAVDSRLDALQREHALRVVTGSAADAVLGAVDGVEQLEAATAQGGRWSYRLRTREDAAPAVARALAAADIPLFSLQPERQDLESLFARVNEEVPGV